MQHSWLRSTVLGSVLVFAFVACGDDGGDDGDDTPDAAADGGDAGRDAGDAGRDGGSDGGDASRDGGDIDSSSGNDGAIDMDTSVTPNEGGAGDTGVAADAGEDAALADGGMDAGDEDSGSDAGEDASEDAGETVTFADVYDDVIAGTCTGCHDADDPRAGLDLSSASVAYDELVDQDGQGECDEFVRVVAGEPDESLLLLKVAADPLPCGSRMPAGGMPALPDDEIALIRAWIEQGALEGP